MSNLGRVPLGRLVLGRGGGPNLNPSFSDTLVLTDNFSNSVIRPHLDDSLAFTETMLFDSYKLHDTLVFTDRFRTSYERTLYDPLIFVDQIRKPTFKTISETLTFSDSFVRIANRYLLTPDQLLFTESVTNNTRRAESLSDIVLMSDTFHYNATLHKTISDTLPFYDGWIIRSRAATTPTIIVPPTGGGNNPISAVIRIFPHTVLKGRDRAITLPAANFNDFEAPANKMIVKRSMDGTYRTYVKTSSRVRYHWSFTIPRPKADEFKLFLYIENGREIDIEDWEGRLYKAKILSDTVDFTESRRWDPCGNATEVTIEFEGVQYA